jgi:peptidoglycan/xylan/chitin deacetylase (PgdA/CDA1 family)
MTLLHAPRFAGWARDHLLCRIENVSDRFALTFDDGPNPLATGAVLEGLARHRAHATFFMLGGHVRRHPELVRRLVDEGHEPGVHGESHWPLALLPPWVIRGEIHRTSAAIVAASGIRPRHFRPPFGIMMPGQARFVRRLGLESVLGDVYPEDPHHPGVDRIISRVLARLCGGSIVILHDGSPFGGADRSQTIDALDRILSHATRVGLRAVTVADLVTAPASG